MAVSTVVSQRINNPQSMFEYCTQSIQRLKFLDDLLPFISSMLSIQEIKQLLQSKLNAAIESDHSKMRSIYIESSSITEILPSDIVVKCIKFLDTDHYKYLPLLSKSIHNIMSEKHTIYNNVCIFDFCVRWY